MEQILDFVVQHGVLVIFVVVFLDQMGLPIPTAPVLLGLGALAGAGRIDPLVALGVGTLGSVCADLVWFELGRWKGRPTLAFICRVALEPDTCVSKTQGLLARYGLKSLLVAKFVPGFDTVAPALAAIDGVKVWRFALWTAGGAVIWLGVFGGLGYAFSGSIERVVRQAEGLGSALGVAVVLFFAGFVGWKYVQRRRVIRGVQMARIAPEELHEKIVKGEKPAIVDVRGEAGLRSLPFVIPGALFITLEELERRAAEIPRDRDVVFYCT
jgi:membrane protein DedA with SNARE-associated domain